MAGATAREGATLVAKNPNLGVTIGIPILGAIAAGAASELPGIHLALTVNVIVAFVSVALVRAGLRPR